MKATAQEINEAILKERQASFNKVQGARVGDYLRLPYGLHTRFTHVHEDSIQTGGGSGSYYFGNGYCSYSGGLDSGAKKIDIIKTTETKEGDIWFFDQDRAGAHRGVHFSIPFRVFELKEGANTSGIPQIKAYEKKQIRDKAEKITRINGNGNPYTLPLPELFINQREINNVALAHIEENTGLKFVQEWGGYKVQPMTSTQIAALFLTYNFKSTYYDNSSYSNMLFLEFNNTDLKQRF